MDPRIPFIGDEIEEIKRRQSSDERSPGGPAKPAVAPTSDGRQEFVITCTGTNAATGDLSTFYPSRKPFTALAADLEIEDAVASDVVFAIRRNGTEVATLTVAAGDTLSPDVAVAVVYGAQGRDRLDVECIDDGGGDYGRVTVSITCRR